MKPSIKVEGMILQVMNHEKSFEIVKFSIILVFYI